MIFIETKQGEILQITHGGMDSRFTADTSTTFIDFEHMNRHFAANYYAGPEFDCFAFLDNTGHLPVPYSQVRQIWEEE
jgi:hypothetical protein